MSNTISVNVKGTSAMDLQTRANALNILNQLPTQELDRLGMLAANEGARKKFNSNWIMIKALTGVK